MIVQIILAVIGFTALTKKRLKISKKRIIKGKRAITLGWLFLIPIIVSLLGDVAELILKQEQLEEIFRILYLISLVIVVIGALYLVVFYKEKK